MMSIKIRLDELACKIGARLYGNGDIIITHIASISSAKSGHITFLKDYRFRDQIRFCKASAIILAKEDLSFCSSSIAALVVKDPCLAYVKIAQLLDTTPKLDPKIALGSVIDLNAILGSRVGIGSNVVIESGVILGDDVKIGAGSFIGKNTRIGTGTCLYPNVTIYHEIEIGSYCIIQSGSVIGSDGFGYIKHNNIWMKIPQLGKVRIGNYVEIGSGTTVDRGTLDDTFIANGVVIDNQCQIAHNVIIGEHTAVAGGVIIAGSVILGKHCMIGGASVINGHISICDQVTITGMSMVIKSIKTSGTYSSGMPIQSNFVWRKNTVLLRNVDRIYKRVKNIENNINNFYFYIKIIKLMCCVFLLGLIIFLILMRFCFHQE